jgi:phosphoketolase
MDQRPLSPAELRAIDAWWRAANYLSVGQIYLLDNPLLRQPLTMEHIKPQTSTSSSSPGRATAGPASSPVAISREPTVSCIPR